jgi:hypothetical protein
VNDTNDVLDWFKYPHLTYQEQVELNKADMERKHIKDRTKEDGTIEKIEWCYRDHILAVRGDSIGGSGDAPMEMLGTSGGLPVGEESHFKFSLQSKNDRYLNFERSLCKDPGDSLRFSYPADHPLAGEFEVQMTRIVRE